MRRENFYTLITIHCNKSVKIFSPHPVNKNLPHSCKLERLFGRLRVVLLALCGYLSNKYGVDIFCNYVPVCLNFMSYCSWIQKWWFPCRHKYRGYPIEVASSADSFLSSRHISTSWSSGSRFYHKSGCSLGFLTDGPKQWAEPKKVGSSTNWRRKGKVG